jgi:hypothetical protein
VAGFNFVSPEYFRVFEIPLRRGRLFTNDEARGEAPVAIVSAATADKFWPGQDPIGQMLRPEPSKDRSIVNLDGYTQIQVIGVVPDVMHGWVFDGRDKTCIYLPASAASKKASNLLISVRGDEMRAVERLRRLMLERWPLQEAQAVPLRAMLEVQIYPFRAAAWLGWMLGLVAMGLSVSGMYGVMSYLVNQRSKEIGIRLALGAAPSAVVALVMRRSLWLAGGGILIGGALAAGAVKILLWWTTSANLTVLTWDSVALLTGAGVAGVAAVLAALGPSSRAARVDPNSVLRSD